MIQSLLPAGQGSARLDDYIGVASELFARQGYDRTTVRDIAKALGVTSGSMFFHFKTKQDLLESVILKGIRDGCALVEAALLEAPSGALQRLRVLTHMHLRLTHGTLKSAHRVWSREWFNLPGDARERLHPLNEQYRRIWADALTSLHAEGYLHGDLEIVRHMLLPALNWTMYWLEDPDEAKLSRLCDEICAVTLNTSAAEFVAMLQGPPARGSLP